MNWKANYPNELTEGRESLEASFVFCLWKQPDLYSDYDKLNENGDESILTRDGQFYFSLGKALAREGLQSFDHVSIYSFLESKPKIKQRFEEYGGMRTVDELRGLVNADNVEAYFDKLVKANLLMKLHDKGFNVLGNLDKLGSMNSSQVYDFFDYQLNSVSISAGHEIGIESLVIDDAFLKECGEGNAMGIGYGKNCRILNYLTMGLPLGEMYMLAGYSGVGKSSFVFENMILPITENGVKCAVISNEMRAEAFKHLLLVHILTQELGFWELTRKKIKQGNFTDIQRQKLEEAKRISETKYGSIRFVKLFDNDIGKVKKVTRKLAKLGYSVIFYDTMKSEDEINEAMWQQLLIHSRKLFQLASREKIALVASYQLALHTLNKRFIDASCLSNGKQIKETFCEMVYLRPLWEDEQHGQKYDVKPYRFERDESGKYQKKRVPIQLDPNKKYVIAFLDKTRNDDDKQTLVYEFNGRFNAWKEIGYCSVFHDRG